MLFMKFYIIYHGAKIYINPQSENWTAEKPQHEQTTQKPTKTNIKN